MNESHPLAAAYMDMAVPEATTVVRKVARTMEGNKQMFDQSKLQDADVSKQMYEEGTGLFNDAPPNFAILRERPEHRLIVYLKAQGLTNKECSERMGYTYGWVCQITRQPWFRQAFLEEAGKAGQDAVKQFLQGEVMPSLQTLVDIRDDTKSKDATRVAASNSILDRFLGKPTQRVETENSSKGLDTARTEVEQLEQQVKALMAQNGLAEVDQPLS